MNQHVELTADHVRKHLLDRAKAYSSATKTSLSAISQAAVKDSKFLANVEKGDNFTLKTYQRVIDWLDEQETGAGEAA
jgi:hypothetical protein